MTDKVNAIGSGTVVGALEYLDFLSIKGHVAPGAIRSLRIAYAKVMKTLGGDDWEKIEVRNVNVDDYMTRFANMTHGQYNANSLIDYKSRVKKVTNWYLQFLAKPGWTPDVKPKTRKTASKTASIVPTEVNHAKVEETIPTPISDSPKAVPTPSNLIAFPFPLANGTLASLYLPQTIAVSDAERMARFIKTLVIDEGISDGQV